MGFWKRDEEANDATPNELVRQALDDFARLTPYHYETETFPKPTPEPTLDVVALSKRWGIDSLADVEYLMGLIDGRETDFLSVAYFPRSTPRKQSDVIAFEARMAFTGKTAKKLLAERDKAAATK